MRIESTAGNQLAQVYVWLTLSEARELRDVLDDMLRTDDPDWHAHMTSADYATEISVARDSA